MALVVSVGFLNAGPASAAVESVTFASQRATTQAVTLTLGSATFTGGMIEMPPAAISQFVYITSSACPGCLPTMHIAFSQPVSNLALGLGNGLMSDVSYTVATNTGSLTKTIPNRELSVITGFAFPSSGIRSVDIAPTTPTSLWTFFLLGLSFETSTLPSVSKQTYVAMGDSFSSGEGNPPFDSGTDVYRFNRRRNGCHRTAVAWPRVLGVTSDHHLACSGATLSDLYAGQEQSAPDNIGQLNRLAQIENGLRAQGSKVGLVTLTIGGNEVGFADILRDCFFIDCLRNHNAVERHIDQLKPQIVRALRTLKATTPGAVVALIGYPRLLPSTQAGNTNCGWLTTQERDRATNLANYLDTALREVAGTAGVTYVSVLDVLAGHELCTSNSWVAELNPAQMGGNTIQGHPTTSGQNAIAARVTQTLPVQIVG